MLDKRLVSKVVSIAENLGEDYIELINEILETKIIPGENKDEEIQLTNDSLKNNLIPRLEAVYEEEYREDEEEEIENTE